jgi:hypothetical protein
MSNIQGAMTRLRLATLSAGAGVGLLFATAFLHLAGYRRIVEQTPDGVRAIVGAAWVAGGLSLIIAALVAIAATPMFVVRRRALLALAGLTPLSIAVLQIVYLRFIPPTALLLVDAALLFASGELGRQLQPVPRATEYAA